MTLTAAQLAAIAAAPVIYTELADPCLLCGRPCGVTVAGLRVHDPCAAAASRTSTPNRKDTA